MSVNSVLTLANGAGMDLRFPTPADYADPDWVAEHLAKEKRYSGATVGVEYSVAQHVCHCCDAAMEIYGDPLIAKYALKHDDEEAALKDDTTPKKRALDEEAAEMLGCLAGDVLKVFRAITDRHNVAIHAAVGLPWPMTTEIAQKVKMIDLTLFVTEWRDLMTDFVHPNWAPYSGIQPLSAKIIPWDWKTAKHQYLVRHRRYFPEARP